MDYAALTAKLAKSGVEYLKAELKKDAANLYSLKRDWLLPIVEFPLFDYEDEAFLIQTDASNAAIIVKAFESTRRHPHCDGASMAPDKIGSIDFVPAALFHDRWYERLEAMAAATGWSKAELRRIGDRIFASIILAENDGRAGAVFFASLYYRAVRLFGGIYHRNKGAIRNAVCVALAATMLGGCAGCVATIFDNDGDGYESPTYEKVED